MNQIVAILFVRMFALLISILVLNWWFMGAA